MAESSCSFDDIITGLQSIRTHHELKLIAREVSRRGTQLTTAKADAFRPEVKVWFHNGAKRISGVVERTEGAYVVVKLEHGFVARIAPDKLRR